MTSLSLASQGSFFVGGRQVTAAGTFDATALGARPVDGQTHWIDQMYVQYQVPAGARKLPLVLVHGGGGTGRVWETTPDGREGYQTLFLRRGHPVYIVDLPRGGRSGFPSFSGEFGRLDDRQQIVANRTLRSGREHAWVRWRLGPRYPEVFPVQAFPMSAVDAFLQHIRPMVQEDAEVASSALIALLERIGPAVLVTHSNAGLCGWLAAARSDRVRAVVSYEPACVFPQGELPQPLPLNRGAMAAGVEVSAGEFANLARVPLQVVFGDNIPVDPVPEAAADSRRAQVIAARLFAAAIERQGGRASVLCLPEAGLRGNSHFMFSDLNNVEVAGQLSRFLVRQGLES
jgi:pimeloyl-ACP methyl ester carboxylesterase